MEGRSPEGHIQDWDEMDVHNWFSSLGYPQYEEQIRDNAIRGDTLCVMNAEHLKMLGVTSVGQRLSILKSIYLVKIAHGVPIEEDHYVPPSESAERSEGLSVEKLNSIVKEQAQRLRVVEEENRTLSTTLQSFIEDFSSFRSSLSRTDDPQDALRRQPSFKWASFKPQKSPTKAEASESPHPSPQRAEHDLSYAKTPGPSNPSTQQQAATVNGADKARTLQPPAETQTPQLRPGRQESSDNLKSFRVSLEDPTWKVLPAALKKYRINNDNWQNYAMFICYGSPGNRIERCLSYDEKPLLLFQKLKDARKNPVFMLKHIKDIRSPIAVAQQKHAARKASSVISQETTATSGHYKGASTSRSANRPPKLEVQDLSATTPVTSSMSQQPSWPEGSLLSPAPGSQKDDDPTAASSSTNTLTSSSSHLTPMSGTTLVSQSDSGKSRSHSDHSESNGRDLPTIQPSSGVSYAVAIYPYMAEQEDEFDVVVGDTFVILSRARGWWVVQRDPTGSGVVDPDTSKQGWVPAGCLLETNVPVAAAIAEANAKNGTNSNDADGNTRTPILPLSIISTSFPGVALMDYKKKGEEELDLVKDDALRVFKRYNHWSYAVKEVGGDRGWVPSWFIGKVLPNGVTPATPGSGIPPLPMTSTTHLEDGANQVSPMSSAFPAVATARPPGTGSNTGI